MDYWVVFFFLLGVFSPPWWGEGRRTIFDHGERERERGT